MSDRRQAGPGPTNRDRRRDRGHDHGFTLLATVAMMLFSGIILGGLLQFSYTTLHNASTYQVRSNESQNVADSVTYALQLLRADPTVGPVGTVTTYHYRSASSATIDVTCTGQGVGTNVVGFFEDRTLICNARNGGVLLLVKVRIYDQVANPGAALEIITWNPVL